MGMIRVSDSAEKAIKEMAVGRTITSVVDELVGGGRPGADTTSEKQFQALNDRLDGMGRFLKEQFEKLQSIIEDTTIDRVEQARGESGGRFSSVSSRIAQTYDGDEVMEFWRAIEEKETTRKPSAAWWNKAAYNAVIEWDEFPETWEIRDEALCFSDGYRYYPIFKAEYFLNWKAGRTSSLEK